MQAIKFGGKNFKQLAIQAKSKEGGRKGGREGGRDGGLGGWRSKRRSCRRSVFPVFHLCVHVIVNQPPFVVLFLREVALHINDANDKYLLTIPFLPPSLPPSLLKTTETTFSSGVRRTRHSTATASPPTMKPRFTPNPSL